MTQFLIAREIYKLFSNLKVNVFLKATAQSNFAQNMNNFPTQNKWNIQVWGEYFCTSLPNTNKISNCNTKYNTIRV